MEHTPPTTLPTAIDRRRTILPGLVGFGLVTFAATLSVHPSLLAAVGLPTVGLAPLFVVLPAALVSYLLPAWVMHTTVWELDAQRRIAQEDALAARDASAAKSRFLANMSHELRTPLSAIIGYSELLREDADQMTAAELRDGLTRVERSAHHLLGLVNDVLDLSKVEAGKMELDIHAFDASEPLATVIQSTRTLVAARHNELVVEMGALGVLHTDSVKVTQCVLNLVSNAARFTENGTVTVRAWRDIERALIVEVVDTGVGIAPDQLSRLFQDFTQADPSTRRHHGGTGLGLSLTRALCALMQGRVTVESEVGVGSTFRLWIPDLRHAMSAASLDPMSRGEALSGK